MKKTFAAFLFLLATCHLVSQTTASVSMLTVNDGLSQGMIFDLIQSTPKQAALASGFP